MGVGKNTGISGFSNKNSNIYFSRLRKKKTLSRVSHYLKTIILEEKITF